jgi:NADH-quinone oxidoreductase subunit C
VSKLSPQELEQVATEIARAVASDSVIESIVAHGETTLVVYKESIVPVIRALKTDARTAFDMLVDVTAVDYLEAGREPRFDVVYHLNSIEQHHRLRLRVPVGEAEDECAIDSICCLYSGANFMERETFDMFGIVFDDHPDPRRILMPDNWEGHPLRKDFPLGGSKSFYYKQDANEYAGEPDDLIPRIRVQEGEV